MSTLTGPIVGLGLALVSIAAWVTHVAWIITKLSSDQGATVSQMVLGGLGAFMPPVGVIHGCILWFS